MRVLESHHYLENILQDKEEKRQYQNTMSTFSKDVSIIIVNYNTKNLLQACISSVIEHTKEISYEIIVSDNGSEDGSKEMLQKEFPQIVLLQNHANLGFGAANNVAAKIAKGKYIFYLNSDTILLSNAVKNFFDFWENTKIDNIGALGAQLLNAEYQPIQSWGKYPTPLGVLKALLHMYLVPQLKKTTKAEKTEPSSGEPIIVNGFITGADLFLKNDEDALFDERYFMYSEETDLEYNHFYTKGKMCVLLPEIEIIHLEGGSDKSIGKPDTYDFGKLSNIYLWLSKVKYLRKNHGEKKLLIAIIKFILLFIWKTPGNKERTQPYIEELKVI